MQTVVYLNFDPLFPVCWTVIVLIINVLKNSNGKSSNRYVLIVLQERERRRLDMLMVRAIEARKKEEVIVVDVNNTVGTLQLSLETLA